MKAVLLRIVLIPLAIALLPLIFVVGQFGGLRGRRPTDLGLRDGKLKRPVRKNTVSSQADLWPESRAHHRVAPLACAGTADETWAKLQAAVAQLPGCSVVEQGQDYLHAECVTRGFKFVDDLELALDRKEGVVHVRSASRLGNSDFGVNRRRVEALRAALNSGS